MEQKKAELAEHLLKTKGIMNPADVDAEITKMAAQCPVATANEKGLSTDVDKAYEVMLIMKGQQTSPTEVAPVVGGTAPTTTISSAEQLNVSKRLLAQKQERAAVSANSSIENLVLDRPAPADYMGTGLKGVIVENGWKNLMEKIEKGTYIVCPDDGDNVEVEKRIASTTNFNILKAAAEAKTPVDVYVGKMSTKAIGYVVNKGTAVGSTNAPVQMTREGMLQFLVMDTAGYILAGPTKPGAKLRYIKGQADPTNPGKSKPAKTLIADANKKAAIESGSYVVSREATKEAVEQTCKSALQIRVQVAGEVLKDGVTPKTRTIRVSLKAAYPELKRKPEFVDVFGTGERESNADLQEVPTGEMAQKINEAQINAIAELRAKTKDPMSLGEVADIADKLAAFDDTTAQAPNAIV